MSAKLLLLVASIGFSSRAAAADAIPILRTTTKTITIIDGSHIKSNYWVLMPERNPDLYYVELPRKPHTVTFCSDIDSIGFPVSYGEERDLVIVQNDNVSCPTRIRAVYRKLQPYSLLDGAATNAIAFRLGDNDKIYVKGQINGGEMMDFQLDLGSGGCLIKREKQGQAKMRFDGTINLINSTGNHVVPASSSNFLQIGNFRWDALPFAVANNLTHRESGLLGNTLFQDKVLEINYDMGFIRVYDAVPALTAGYTKHEIILDGVVPFIRGSLTLNGRKREGWFMFDTGAYTSILFSNEASAAGKLLSELCRLFGKNSKLNPELKIGEYAFANFNYSIRKQMTPSEDLGLLGNDILKRFNVVLDNRNGVVYLQLNSLRNAPFRNPEYSLARVLVGMAIFLAGCCGWLIYRRKVKR